MQICKPFSFVPRCMDRFALLFPLSLQSELRDEACSRFGALGKMELRRDQKEAQLIPSSACHSTVRRPVAVTGASSVVAPDVSIAVRYGSLMRAGPHTAAGRRVTTAVGAELFPSHGAPLRPPIR